MPDQGIHFLPFQVLGIHDIFQIADAALANAQAPVRNQQIHVHTLGDSKSLAVMTGSQRGIEGKQLGLQFWDSKAADFAGVIGRKQELFVIGKNIHHAVCQIDRRFDGIVETGSVITFDDPVHDHIDVVFLVFVQRSLFFQVDNFTIHTGTDESILDELLKGLLEGPLLAADNRSHDGGSRAVRQCHHLIHHFGDCHPLDRFSMFRAVRNAYSGIQKPEIVVNLRDGSDGGAGVIGCRFLIDGNGRGKTVDLIHIRFLRIPEKLSGIGGQ